MDRFLMCEYGVTHREVDVLKQVINGKNNREIALDLNVSFHTIKAHINSLLIKLGVSNRVLLAVKVIRECLKKQIDIG